MTRKEEQDLKEMYDEFEREEEERRMEEVRSLREALEEERRRSLDLECDKRLLELMLRQTGANLSDVLQRIQGR
jgi:hypothetical protein